MKGDADESQQDEVGDIVFGWQGKLPAGEDCDAEDDNPDPEADPNNGDGRDFSQRDFCRDKRPTPDDDGEEGREGGEGAGFGHRL